GAWESIAGPREAHLLIAGNRFAFEFRDGAIYMGEFTLGPDAVPAEMDMRIDEGPVRHRGQVAECIYLLDGNLLRWCAAEPGDGRRLAYFPSTDDDRFLSLVLKRTRS